MLFWQFSIIIICVKIVGKIPDQYLSACVFSNPGDKVQILVESTGQIYPILLHLFWTLSPGFDKTYAFKFWSGIFPTIFIYMTMSENCQNNISVYGYSTIQGTKKNSCWNLMKPRSQNETYAKPMLDLCFSSFFKIPKKEQWYIFQGTSEGDKTLVKELMTAIENRTCIRFQERTGKTSSENL